MTPYEILSLIVSTVSALAVVIGLAFLTRQIREGNQQTVILSKTIRDSSYNSFAGILITFDSVFVEYPDMRQYFYSGKDLLENDDLLLCERVNAIAVLTLDMFDHVLTDFRFLPEIWGWSQPWWEKWIVDIFASSPVLCKQYRAIRDWYPEDLEKLHDRALEQLNANSQTRLRDP